jgi:hypothetical protein
VAEFCLLAGPAKANPRSRPIRAGDKSLLVGLYSMPTAACTAVCAQLHSCTASSARLADGQKVQKPRVPRRCHGRRWGHWICRSTNPGSRPVTHRMPSISVAGFASCPFHQRALVAARKLVDTGERRPSRQCGHQPPVGPVYRCCPGAGVLMPCHWLRCRCRCRYCRYV